MFMHQQIDDVHPTWRWLITACVYKITRDGDAPSQQQAYQKKSMTGSCIRATSNLHIQLPTTMIKSK